MSLPSLTGVLTVAFLVVPGFFSFLIVRNLVPSKRKKFSDYETTIFSLIYALPILATYFLISKTGGLDSLTSELFQVWNLALLFGLAVFYGVVPGIIAKIVIGGNQVVGECWDEFGKGLGDSADILVFTKDGREYKGWIKLYDCTEDRYELIIGDPEFILRDDKWKVLQEIKMGSEMLFTQKDILRISKLEPSNTNGKKSFPR